jgi:peptide/nickel transport system permease protein
MIQYVIRRLLVAVVLVYVVVTLLFAFLHVLPGDPAQLLLSAGGNANPSPQQIAALDHKLGVDRPILEQYGSYLGGLVRGDLGHSFQSGNAVAADVAQRLPRTLELVVLATLIAIVLGVPLGTLAAMRRGSPLDVAIGAFSATGIAVPVFVVGTLLVLVFAQLLALTPAGGYTSFTTDPVEHLSEVLLPAISIALGLLAIVARMTRSAMLDVLGQDYMRTARAKGAGRLTVIVRHGLRNAIGPVVTVTGLQMGSLLGGTVLVEYVFNWPGLSSLLVQSVEQRDYPEVQAIVLVISTLFILLNLAVDLARAALDPRVRGE